MNTQEFGIADILTQTSGRLLTPIGDVYKFLEWVSGEDGLMTHQLPRVSREVEPFLREQFPDLAAIDIADVPIKMPLGVARGQYMAYKNLAKAAAPVGTMASWQASEARSMSWG